MSMKKTNKEFVYDRLIQLFWFTVILCSLLKFLGFKEFEIPLFNIELNIWVRRIINALLFSLNGICFQMILVKRKLKPLQIILTFTVMIPIFCMSFDDGLLPFKWILEILVSYALSMFFFSEEKPYKRLIESFVIYCILVVYQLLTSLYKNVNLITMSFIVELILQIDYYIIIVLTILKEFKKGDYIYERWKTFILFLSKRNSFKENVQQNQENVQKVEVELGYKIFIVMLSITQLFLVGTICHFVNNVILEYLLIFISFVFMRQVYGKSYHSDSVLVCTTLAVLVFVTATRLSLPLYISVLCNILIGCLVAYMMYVMYCYMNYTNYDGITLRKGMLKEDLIKLCDIAGLTEQATNRMVLKYIERKTLQEIADIEYIDYQTANQSIYRSKQKIKQALKDEPFK